MKNTWRFVLLFCALAFCLAAPASAALPEGHAEYMKNEGYENAFGQFTLGMQEAKERLSPDEYSALEKEGDEVIAGWVKEDMASGTSEENAYEAAYWARYEYVSLVLRWDWLKKNAEDAQGFYRFKSDAFDGYMTLEKGGEDGQYAVKIDVVMKNEPNNSGNFEGFGLLTDGLMTVSGADMEHALVIGFDGETANVATSAQFDESDWLGEGVAIDGEYVREKK